MSLRARLALVLGAVLLGPLIAAVVAVGIVVPRAATSHAQTTAVREAGGVAVALAARCQAVGDTAAGLAAELAADVHLRGRVDDAATQAATRRAALRRPGTAIVVVDRGAKVRGWGGAATDAATAGTAAAQLRGSSCSLGTAPGADVPAALAESVRVDVRGGEVATVIAWVPADDALLRSLRDALGGQAQAALIDHRALGRPARFAEGPAVVAGSGRREDLAPALRAVAGGALSGTVSAGSFAMRDPGPGLPYGLLVVAPVTGGGLVLALAVGAVAAVLLAAALVHRIAARLTGPLAELTSTADRLGAGDLGARTATTGDDDVGRLAAALDAMASRLQSAVGELQVQRDVLADTFDRFGEALGRTHDLDGLLRTVVEAAVQGADGVAGIALLGEPAGGAESTGGGAALVERVRVVRHDVPGAAAAADALSPLAALAVERGVQARVEALAAAGPAVALPLRAGDTVVGALALARAVGARGVDSAATERVEALASRAGTAIANVRAHEETRRLSVTDPLTGVGNLRHLSTTLSREVERATRFDRPLTVLMLDLDHFKQINDTHGHAFGDVVLREFARRLSECLREVDTVARYGGEEFAVILPETDGDGGARVAERVLAAVRAEPFTVGDTTRAVTVSIGVASFPVHGRSAAEVLRSADTALYAAKAAGRDRWCAAGMPGDTVTVPADAVGIPRAR